MTADSMPSSTLSLSAAFPDPDAARLRIIEAALFVSHEPLKIEQLLQLFDPSEQVSHQAVVKWLSQLQTESEARGVMLVEVANGWRYQSRQEYQPWLVKLQEDKPRRYGRALLETLALIAYRQPITRGEIEEVRGVAVATSVMRTLLERRWIRPVGRRDIPGRPITFGTTDTFLSDFGLRQLADLPTLAQIKSMAELEPGFDFEDHLESETSFAQILGSYQAQNSVDDLHALDDELAASWQATDAINSSFSNQMKSLLDEDADTNLESTPEMPDIGSELAMTEREVADAIAAKLREQEAYLERKTEQDAKDDTGAPKDPS